MEKPKIKLVLTCGACPEQYDAFCGEEKVGYLRLRHGHFTVHYQGVAGERIYTACPNGDGIFEKEERDYYLRFAVDAIQRRMRGEEILQAPDVEYEVDGDASKWEW